MGLRYRTVAFFLAAVVSSVLLAGCGSRTGYKFAPTPRFAVETMANLGDADAQCELGRRYLEGTGGVNQDPGQAFKWLKAAADQQNACGLNNLGRLYGLGLGVPQDTRRGVALFRQAAAMGYPGAELNLGKEYEPGGSLPTDYRTAAHYFELAAAHGDVIAYNELGVLYETGAGVPRDLRRAEELYRLGAQAGDGRAEANLGRYFFIRHVYASAFRWDLEAYQAGFPTYDLGAMYFYGLGTKSDLDKARVVFGQVIARQQPGLVDEAYSDAVYFYGMMLVYEWGGPKNVTEGHRYLIPAAQHGDVQADCLLAHDYATGTGVKRDLSTAMRYYLAGARGGQTSCQIEMGNIYESHVRTAKTGPSARDLAQAYFWFSVAQPNDSAGIARRHLHYLTPMLSASQRNSLSAAADRFRKRYPFVLFRQL